LLGLATSEPTAKAQTTPQITTNSEPSFSAHKIAIDTQLARLRGTVNRVPYVFSGDTRRGWDCSGLVAWFYRQLGQEIPHSANKQAHLGTRVSVPKPGDIVAFAYAKRTDFYHSGIYLGHGKIINANLYYGTTVIETIKDYKYSQIRYIRLNERG
jgi:cell wall-associated NlpC family hydrolase